jgi:hypothetical protein
MAELMRSNLYGAVSSDRMDVERSRYHVSTYSVVLGEESAERIPHLGVGLQPTGIVIELDIPAKQ